MPAKKQKKNEMKHNSNYTRNCVHLSAVDSAMEKIDEIEQIHSKRKVERNAPETEFESKRGKIAEKFYTIYFARFFLSVFVVPIITG